MANLRHGLEHFCLQSSISSYIHRQCKMFIKETSETFASVSKELLQALLTFWSLVVRSGNLCKLWFGSTQDGIELFLGFTEEVQFLQQDEQNTNKMHDQSNAKTCEQFKMADKTRRQYLIAWPSGLRHWIKAPVSLGAWFQIPLLPWIGVF